MPATLYSFRRCPFAMRARLAISYCLPKHSVELREVVLRDKPASLINISPKATVPVFQLEEGQVLEESLDIVLYALSTRPDLEQVLLPDSLNADILRLIKVNDGEFKCALDRYKYADRYEQSQAYYREKGELFLDALNERLNNHRYLMCNEMTLADLAIFPFVRQFAHVDKQWFEASHYTALVQWLDEWLASDLFISIMTKYPQWQEGDDPVYFP